MNIQNNKILKPVVSLFLLLMSTSSYAVTVATELGLQFGGDTIYTAVFVGGETKDISAGDGIQLSIGANFDITETTYIKALIGFNTKTIRASNGSIDWNYTPINIMFYKKVNRWDFGAGLTLHSGLKLSGTGVASSLNNSYKNSTGYSLQANYRIGSKGYFGAKYTIMTYTDATKSYNANSFGLIMGANF